ncbi:MAG: hypothetical protein ACQEQS_04275 [Thermodesulfobacteriota bacterium]
MKKRVLFIFIILIIAVSASAEKQAKNSDDPGIKPGMMRSQVRAEKGIPLQMRGRIWKYSDVAVIFQSGSVECIIKAECFGKWSGCNAFIQRSPECVISAE